MKATLIFALLILSACAPKGKGGSEESSSNAPLTVVSESRTTRILAANRIVPSMVSCTGIGKAGPEVQDMWNDKKGTLSADGDAGTVTAPMLMAQAALAGEVCAQLIGKEKATPIEQRRIFTLVNFAAGPSLQSEVALHDATARMARSCWGRNITASEAEKTVAAARSGFVDEDETEEQLTFICSAILSSLSFLSL